MPDDFEEKLDRLKAAGGARPRPDCPSETEWLRLAAGLLLEPQAGNLLDHSAECDACAILLRQAAEDFAEETTEQEDAALQALQSAQPAWQGALAQELAARSRGGEDFEEEKITPMPRPQPRPVFRQWWAYAAAAVMLLLVGSVTLRMIRKPSLDQLIATAYTERRTLELRIAGAERAEVRQQRRAGSTLLEQPRALRDAATLVEEKLKTHPDDRQALAGRARIRLLEGDYDAAINELGRLVDAYPDSPDLLTDLATAYFQRSEVSDNAKDNGAAIEYLGQALQLKPGDPVALFNRAIASERMGLYNEAVRDWAEYLKADPAGAWADEARRRLSDLQTRMKEREKPLGSLHVDPVKAAPLLRARAAGAMAPGTPWAPALDEEYLSIAVTDWLPALYVPVGGAGQPAGATGAAAHPRTWRRDAAAWEALSALAHVARAHHGDQWLTDLLWDLPGESSPPERTAQFAATFHLLAGAARANTSGDPDTARPLAEEAGRSFRALGSQAGELRAREAYVYSLVRGPRAQRAQECIQMTRRLAEDGHGRYAWLVTQALTWQASCQYAIGNVDLAQQLSEKALEATNASGYAGQHLRSVMFASGFLDSAERNWQGLSSSVRKFWASWHNPFHAYESFGLLALTAGEAGHWRLEQPLRREALGMIARTPDRPFQAVAHHRLATAALKTNDLEEGETHLLAADRLLAVLANQPSGRARRAVFAIELAALEIQRGKLEAAAAHLEEAGAGLAGVSVNWTVFNHQQTLGQLHLRRGQTKEAEAALHSALAISERYLSQVESDADRLAWERDAQRGYRALVELYTQKAETTQRALEAWEWYRGSALRAAAGAQAPARPEIPPVADALEALRDETVLSYAVLPSGVVAWSFDDRGVHFARVPVEEKGLLGRVKKMAFLCADGRSDLTRLREEGRQLYGALVAPLEGHLDPGRTLIIEPDLFLSEVPWAALVDARGEYLGERFALVISPGLGYLRHLRAPKSISADKPALVVGMPALAAEAAARFPPLPDANREAQRVAAYFPRARVLSGAEVTDGAIRQGLGQSVVFHFAGHAVAGVSESGLVLASPAAGGSRGSPPTERPALALFSGTSLAGANLDGLQLVVLSACATAETKKGFGEPDTLVRAFLRAGVPRVVASQWPVDSASARQIMTLFYDGLLKDQAAPQALRHAAGEVRRRPATAHPFHWAAFVSFGR